MTLHWQSLLTRFEAFSFREQILLGATLAALTVFGLQLSVIDPLNAKQHAIENELAISKGLTLGYKRQLGKGENREEQNKSERLKVEIKLVQDQIDELTTILQRYSENMVPAEEMPTLLQVMLAKSDLQLVSLTNIDPVPVMLTPEDASESDKRELREMQLYRHGISIKLRGEYSSILNYMSELEKQKWKFNWRSMVYEVSEYPKGEIDLRLQTLSQDERWMGV